MPLKYGRCTNPSCILRGKTQDAEDSSFVCEVCQTVLMESLALVPGEAANKNKPLWVTGMVLLAFLLSGGVYFWVKKQVSSVVSVASSGKLLTSTALPKPEPKNTDQKPLEEWLDDYSVDR